MLLFGVTQDDPPPGGSIPICSVKPLGFNVKACRIGEGVVPHELTTGILRGRFIPSAPVDLEPDLGRCPARRKGQGNGISHVETRQVRTA